MSRVGQTILGVRRGRMVPVVCEEDGSYVHWKSLDLESSGSMLPSKWDEIKAAQTKAIDEANETEARTRQRQAVAMDAPGTSPGTSPVA